MNTELSSERIAAYRRDGVLFHPGLLDAGEVDRLRTALLDAAGRMGRQKVAGGNDALVDAGDQARQSPHTQRINLWRIDDTVRSFMLDEALGRMVCELEDRDAMRVWHDQALVKEPFGRATGWHLDNPFWSFHSTHAITVWIALEEVTPLNGCLCFLPGTHRQADFARHAFGGGGGDLFDLYPEMAECDTLALPMKPGDCSFHNGLTAHSAGANMTRGRRIAMTCAYMPDGSVFNGQQNVLPREYFERLRPGDVLDNDDWNPMVARR